MLQSRPMRSMWQEEAKHQQPHPNMLVPSAQNRHTGTRSSALDGQADVCSVPRCAADVAGGTPGHFDQTDTSKRCADSLEERRGMVDTTGCDLDGFPLVLGPAYACRLEAAAAGASPSTLVPQQQGSAQETQAATEPQTLASAAAADSLATRVAACEFADSELRRLFAERSAELLHGVQAGFAEARGHLDIVVQQLSELNSRVHRQEKMMLNSNSSTGAGQATLGEGLCDTLLKRIADLEDRVCDNGTVVGALRTNILAVQQRLVDVKCSIDSALIERKSSSTSSPHLSVRSGSEARLQPLLSPRANQDMAVCITQDGNANISEGVPARTPCAGDATPPEISLLSKQTASIEAQVSRLHESMAALLVRVSGLEERMPEDQAVRIPDIKLADRPQALTSGLSKVTAESPAAEAWDGAGAWLEADAVLGVVGKVVARQQRELASLTANLKLQCTRACHDEVCQVTQEELGQGGTCLRASPECGSTSLYAADRGGDQAGRAESRAEDAEDAEAARTAGAVGGARSAGSPAAADEREGLEGPGRANVEGGSPEEELELDLEEEEELELEEEELVPSLRPGGPWSALAHLSAALTGFEAVLHGVEQSGPGRTSRGRSGHPSTSR